MCLAVPLKITEIKANGKDAVAERDGVWRNIDVSFIREPKVGDFVVVHAGFAIERLSQKQADDVLESYNELMAEIEGLA